MVTSAILLWLNLKPSQYVFYLDNDYKVCLTAVDSVNLDDIVILGNELRYGWPATVYCESAFDLPNTNEAELQKLLQPEIRSRIGAFKKVSSIKIIVLGAVFPSLAILIFTAYALENTIRRKNRSHLRASS